MTDVESASAHPMEGIDERITSKRPLDDDEQLANKPETSSPPAHIEPMKRPRLSMDAGLEKRSKRFLGVLKGTLSQFIKETSHKTEAEKKREELEHRLAEKLKKDKEQLAEKVKKEQEERFARRQLEKKQEDEQREQQAKEWIRQQKRNISNFIQTKSVPPIFFLPKNHNDTTLELLAEAKRHLALETAAERTDGKEEDDKPEEDEGMAQSPADKVEEGHSPGEDRMDMVEERSG
ncbi:uncharacterized protein SPPG_04812 [Spizellomyces punctatus DAOM BR117]|uniref:Pinin/SDK/MemA protein domain-containing protein n=1 Tax=Spizellomyces punctatus (strain DAOM BR117) TaxID=645134 RepID=A0A0L0HHE5_SPIPD|nr:uncharacterized protein SPPG_04812 [Spizellomyces punctatus DAOM BR117]KND00497.1 hypothetical protein SPPG_04812 [Spizellomyces punctatus DAOM BR117]|eukprot:XP_016608536.1 hypothetical protein SPPG_04812 [Spizellomyces punctatus DAOM BR117]